MKLAASPICENNPCTDAAVDVHHVVAIKVDMSRSLEYANLMSVCRSCHKLIETPPPPSFFLHPMEGNRSVPRTCVPPNKIPPGVRK